MKNIFELSELNKNELTCMIEAVKIELHENMEKFEDILKVSHTHTYYII